MNAIVIKGLTKRFGSKTAVSELELIIEKGELFALLGLNGAGKTTAIKMLSCLTAPTEGEAVLMGHNVVAEAQAVKEFINISPQETAVARNLTVEENLIFIAGIYGSRKAQAAVKADEMIQRFALTEVRRDKAKTLSGGMQRRLSIAMALITDPEILFLDEPTLGLDVIARRELWSLIAQLKGHKTMILTTHYMEEAQALSDRIGIMARGVLTAAGTAEELISRTGEETFEDAFIKLAQTTEVLR